MSGGTATFTVNYSSFWAYNDIQQGEERESVQWLTDHFQEAYLTLHRVAVYLTHVPAPVRLLDVLDPQLPNTLLRETDSDAMILCNDVVLDGEDGLRVHAQPGDFEGAQVLHEAG